MLRISAAVTALGALAQAGLGLAMVMGTRGILSAHSGIAYLTMAAAVVAGVAAGLWSRRGGNTGMMMHALTVAVLAVLQFGLGEMGMRTVHIAIGVAFLVAAVALATLAYRKPYAASPEGALNESTHHHEG
ncbi:hypothetical protein B0O41_0673 [Propionibacteriaceae bacterium ES.041]|uniref:Integral membrane protein n=1 Tax=Enemella evansiae TaxID=2016499 RepID=A0A255GT19_9ACTN|nr:hypothetical protein CGZ97_21015 [Enemella evansiae]PFG65898.1 hypothetical protein B0O41_0673 [Propionibacteriaceae bacterium ES.041]OYO13952.1 hypothetical protein CGZ98_05050 [Enemella evansiae]OYO16184.1 hypothetical protein CGZ94_05585 [Enemella evansiae]OYO18538.1 hypothetical protein BI335_07620 [Enemella evansiae]